MLADIDGDGDLDLLVGTATGAIVFYRNDGTAKDAKFVLVSEQARAISRPGRRSRPAFVDSPATDSSILLVGRETGGAVAVPQHRHAHARRDSSKTSRVTLALPPISTPLAIDLDGDGRIEILAGTVSGGLVYWR